MLDFYDDARTILSSCKDLDAVITMIEETEDHADGTVTEACLATVRCSLTAVAAEIRPAAEAIAERAGKPVSA